MSQYNNQGYLFPNLHKRGDAPDYTGKITVNGVELRISAWKKVKRETEMLSLSVKTQEEFEADKACKKALPKEKDYEYQEPVLLEHQNGLEENDIPF